MLCLWVYTVVLVEDVCLCLAVTMFCVESSGRSLRKDVKKWWDWDRRGMGLWEVVVLPPLRFGLCVIASAVEISGS